MRRRDALAAVAVATETYLALQWLGRTDGATPDERRAELGITSKAANAALHQTAEAGVLLQYGTLRRGRGQQARLFVSKDLLGLVGSTPLR